MKKGFTLMEMLAVILLISVVSLIIVPKVTDIIKNQKRDLYDKQAKRIEEVAKSWAAQNTNELPDSGSVFIGLDRLLEDGFVSREDLVNPKDEEELTGCVQITFDEQYNQYTYKFIDSLSDTYNNECNS